MPLFSLVPLVPTCSDGEVRLQSTSVYSLNEGGAYSLQISGIVEICYNETFRGLCTSGNYNFLQTAELVCSSLGYTGELLIKDSRLAIGY